MNLPTQVAGIAERSQEWWAGAPPMQKYGALGGGIVGIALLIFMFFTMSDGKDQWESRILYSDLEFGESAEISNRLRALEVPHRLTADATAILVPEDRYMELRVQLAHALDPAVVVPGLSLEVRPHRFVRQDQEGLRRQPLEQIAHQDRHVLAVDLVGSRASPPKIVVVHRRQIVVNEAEGVDRFQSDRPRQGVTSTTAARLAGTKDQEGTKSLPPAKQGVSRRLVEQRSEPKPIDRFDQGSLDLAQ